MEKSHNKSVQDSQNSVTLSTGKNCIEDGCSSTETLSAEERHTLKHTQRQEPQGEEQVYANSISSINVPSMIGSSNTYLSRTHDDPTSISTSVSRNNDSNLSISSGSNTNTLIIHHSIPDQSLSHHWLSNYSPVTKPMRERSLQPTGTDAATFVTRVNSKYSEILTTSNSYNSGISVLSTSLLDSSANLSASALKTPLLYSNRMMSPTVSPRKYAASTELLDIPSSYLDQSEVLKHLIINKESKESSRGFINGVNLSTYGGHMSNMGNISGGCSDQSASSSNSAINIYHNERGSVSGSSSQSSQHIMNALDHRDDSDMTALYNRLPPPPAYPLWQLDSSNELKDTGPDSRTDKNLLSKSQPDLTRVCALKDQTPMKEIFTTRFDDDDDSPTSMKELVNILTHENSALKLEIDICHRKVAKLQRFELEMAKVEEQYEALVKLCERREQLERLARHKLNTEVRRLTEQNNELREHLEVLNGQGMNNMMSSGAETPSAEVVSLRKELDRRDVFIAQLVSQNKELSASKERQEMELTAQRQTLNEQRTHIDILDSALTNAQTNVVKLEEEVRKKQNLVEQAGQLKRLLLSIKLAADRREQSERNLRQKLEMEILQLRSNAKMDQSSSENSELRRELREKEEKIMLLEGEVTKWEQRFLQESAMRQMAIEAASMPKDAKIAALERNGQDSDRRIAQAESDKLRHVDEINNMSRKISALENRNRSLESHNAEREAMIKALHKRYEEKDLKSQSSSLASMKMEYPITSNQTATQGSPKHQHSTSVSNISTPSMFPATPRKDEELGNYLSSNYLQYYQNPYSFDHPNKIYPESKIAQDSHTKSGSYCCYVNPFDQSEIINNSLSEKSYDHPVIGMKQHVVDTGEDDPFAIEKKQVLFQLRTYDQSRHVKGAPLHPKSVTGYPVTAQSQPNQQVTLSSTTSNMTEIQTSRGDPPPYFSQHQVLKVSPTETQQPFSQLPPAVHISSQNHMQQVHLQPQSQQLQSQAQLPNAQLQTQSQHQSQAQQQTAAPQSQPSTAPSIAQSPNSPPLARPVAVCQRPHPPNAFCRTCLSVRRSHRQNAAAFVRRANSSGYQHNRRSAPSPASSADSLDDAPSILERLKKEWEMGFLGPPSKKEVNSDKKTEGSKTLPHPLGTLSTNLSSSDDKDRELIPSSTPELPKNEDSNEKKDVAHLDRALNRLSMKRSSNPFGQKYNLKNIDTSVVADLPAHEQQNHHQQQQPQNHHQQQPQNHQQQQPQNHQQQQPQNHQQQQNQQQQQLQNQLQQHQQNQQQHYQQEQQYQQQQHQQLYQQHQQQQYQQQQQQEYEHQYQQLQLQKHLHHHHHQQQPIYVNDNFNNNPQSTFPLPQSNNRHTDILVDDVGNNRIQTTNSSSNDRRVTESVTQTTTTQQFPSKPQQNVLKNGPTEYIISEDIDKLKCEKVDDVSRT